MKKSFFLLFNFILLIYVASCKTVDPGSMQRSRYGLGTLDLKIPKDAVKILDYDFAKDGKGKTTKYVTYLSKDGNVYTKEYRDGVTELEGKIKWLGAGKLQK